MKKYAWLNNQLVNSKGIEFFLSSGFLYGQGLFETMRSYGGRVFLLERHIQRLIDSCGIMGIAAPRRNSLRKAVMEVSRKNKLSSAYLRLNVWKENKGVGIFVFAADKKFYRERDYKKGFSAVMIRDVRQNECFPMAQVKSLNHYFYILLGEKAKNSGVDEAIILNSKGSICEGSRSNIFIVKKGKIFTPPVSDGCLPGVTRQFVMEIARKLKIDLSQKHLKPRDLLFCDEAFLTNSLIEVMPLARVDSRLIGAGVIGRTTKAILDKYHSFIKE